MYCDTSISDEGKGLSTYFGKRVHISHSLQLMLRESVPTKIMTYYFLIIEDNKQLTNKQTNKQKSKQTAQLLVVS
jgi:hypothetical protein